MPTTDATMSGLELECWEDLDDATCRLPDGHDGPHEPTPNSAIFVELISVDDRASEDADLRVKTRKEN